MNVSVERAQGHQNAIHSIKICAKAKTELADISQNCFHEARIVLLQTELFSKIHLLLILCVIIIAEMICSDTGVIWENSVKLINFRWELIFLKNL